MMSRMGGGLGLLGQSRPGQAAGGGGGAAILPFVEDAFAISLTPISAPSAIYDATANKTFVTYCRWDGFQQVAQVETYNHATSQWETSYSAGTSILHDDSHGGPAMTIGPNGNIWVFYGPHNGLMRVRVSTNARDPSAWTELPDTGSTLTYPNPVFSGNDLYLFARQLNAGSSKDVLTVSKAPSATGTAATFTRTTIGDYGTDSRFYFTNIGIGPDGYIWLLSTRADYADTFRRDIYLYRYDPATGNILNIDGSVTTTSASYPLGLTAANASYRVVTTSATGCSGSPAGCFDSSNNFHLIWHDSASANGQVLSHMAYVGGSWTGSTALMTTGNKLNSYAIKAVGTGVEILGCCAADFGRGGSIYSITRSSGGVFGTLTLVADPTDAYLLGNPKAVRNGLDAFRWIYLDMAVTGVGSARVPDDTDAASGIERIYAYGSGGYLPRTTAAVTLNRTTVKAGLAVGDIVAYIDSRRPRETLTLTDASGKFAISGRNLVTAAALSVGSYPITITSTCRGTSVSTNFTITVNAAVDITDSALAILNFTEGSGQTVGDSSGHGLNGFLGTTTGVQANDMAWVVGGGIENDTASAKLVKVPYQPIMQRSAMHFFLAVQPLTSVATNGFFASRRNDYTTQQDWYINHSAGKPQFASYTQAQNGVGGTANVATAPSVTLVVGTWTLLEFEVNGTSIIIRQDGAAILTGTLGAAIGEQDSADLLLGTFITSANALSTVYFRGRYGCFHWYPRPLSSGEATSARNVIKALMSGRGVTLP